MRRSPPPSFRDLFTPKLVTVLREGYGLTDFRADVIAGLTVAIVALPLSMAIAIASGVTPDRGLYTAIIGGFLVSLLGGSRFQIGGPAGAFIVLVAAIVEREGFDGLVLATAMAGLILVAVGFLRLGTYIRYIPYPVTIGFTAGIAVIIFSSQIKDLFGLHIAGHEPAAFVPKLQALAGAWQTVNLAAVGVAAASLAIILGLRRWRPHWPGLLIAVVVCGVAVWALGLPVETIGSRFGGVPRSLPAPGLPAFDLARLVHLIPDAITIAMLGGIESLLSAVVADGMSGRRHRSNSELVGQGVANVGSVLFGGICVTGTIARTATNVRAGSRGPVSGILHSFFLLVFMLVAAPLASYIPLATLAAILTVVAWNMAEKHALMSLLRNGRGEALVLLATLGLTVFRDLTEAIAVGVVLGALLFMHRMAEAVEIETHHRLIEEDRPDTENGREHYDAAEATDEDVMVYRLNGPFFFGATANVVQVVDRLGATPKAFILDFAAVPFVDSSGANALAALVEKFNRGDTRVYFSAAVPSVRRALVRAGLKPPRVRYAASIATARAAARESDTVAA